MKLNLTDTATFRLAEKALDLRSKRMELISGNLANVDTPGYLAKDIDFEQTLADAVAGSRNESMTATSSSHISMNMDRISEAEGQLIFRRPVGNLSPDGNTVDLDREVTKLAENEIHYRTAAKMLKRRLGALRYAIDEVGR